MKQAEFTTKQILTSWMMIDIFLELAKHGENDKYTDNWNPKDPLKRLLIEAKIQIDRHNLVTNNYIIHPKHEQHFRTQLNIPDNEDVSIWGGDIHFSENCPEDLGIALCFISFDMEFSSKNVVVFPIN